MIGYRSIEHQGHTAAKIGKADEANPYPRASGPFYEYQNGCNAFRRGDVIDIRGDIVAPTMNTVKHSGVHRPGTGW